MPIRSLRRPEPRRLAGLSDAPFSIIITLPDLKLHRPAATVWALGHELVNGWSSYVP